MNFSLEKKRPPLHDAFLSVSPFTFLANVGIIFYSDLMVDALPNPLYPLPTAAVFRIERFYFPKPILP